MQKYHCISDILTGKISPGESARLRGWVYRKREQKNLVFIILRDSSGIIQLACKDLEEARNASIESSIEVSGSVKEDSRAPGGFELDAKSIKIIGLAERFPIAKDLSEEFLRDIRHLWVRSRYITEILKVRSEVFFAIHEFYKSKGFYQVQAPSFTGASCEGGSTLFEVKYFDKKAYLTQSWQLYAEALIYSLERIYTIAPSFRAEQSRTIRHLAEYWHHEMEAAWMGHDELMAFEEELITYIIKHVLTHCKAELAALGRDVKELEAVKAPFKRITYKEAVKKLGKRIGEELTDKDERELVQLLGNKPVFLTSFLREKKAFYMRPDPLDTDAVLASDLLVPGVGEITGGSERIFDIKELLDSIKLFKLKKQDYEWYIDLRRYGTIPHSGFGLGIDRLVLWLTGAKHIMDTIPFPRTMERLYP